MRIGSKIWVVLLKVVLAVAFLPVALFLVVASLLYVPAVQDYVSRRAVEAISGTTGLDVDVGRVRLAFPLDLAVDSLVARDGADTLLAARTLRLNVEFLPLLSGQANVNGIDIQKATLDTRDYVGDAHVRGRIGRLRAATNGVYWEGQRVTVDYATLRNADLCVCLSDTALDDTAKTPSHWMVEVMQARLQGVRARVALADALPSGQDSLRGTQTWLCANVGDALLRNGLFDTGRSRYALQGFRLREGNIAYRAEAPGGLFTRRSRMNPIPPDKERSHVDTLRSWYTYTDPMEALAAWQPFSGLPARGGKARDKAFDAGNIVLTDVGAEIDGLTYNERGVLRTDVRSLSLKEQSGIAITDLAGPIYMDSERLRLPEMTLRTPHSRLRLSLDLPFAALQTGRATFNTDVDLTLGWQDVVEMGQAYLPADVLKLYPHTALHVQGRVSGTPDDLRLQPVRLELPGYLAGCLQGRLRHLSAGSPSADLTYDLQTGAELPALYRKALPDVASTVTLPARVDAKGHLALSGNDYTLRTTVAAEGGNAHVDAHVNLNTEVYAARVAAQRFPLPAFLPGMELSAFTGKLQAGGRGFDPTAHGARADVQADVQDFAYSGYALGGTKLAGTLRDQAADVQFEANSHLMKGNGHLTATLGEPIQGTLTTDLQDVDLLGLGVTTDTVRAGVSLNTAFTATRDLKTLHVEGNVAQAFFTTPTRGFDTDDLNFAFTTEQDSTWATAESGDLVLRIGTHGDLDRLLPRLTQLGNEAARQLEARELNQERLKRELPPMTLYLKAGQLNPLSRILRLKGYSFSSAYVDLAAHPATGLSGVAQVGALQAGSLLLDTIHVDVRQDSSGVQLDGQVKNYTKANPTKFEAHFHSYLLAKGAGIEAQFYDSDGEKGVDIGLRADLVEGGINLVLYPEQPVLAYRNFTINRDNYIFLGTNKQIRADVDLLADDGTGLRVHSEAADSVNDITLSVNHVNLGELSNVLPYLPKMEGLLDGDFHVFDNHTSLSAMGSFEAQGFSYEGTALGNVGADVVYLPKGDGEHYASAFIRSAGEEVLEAEGTYHEADAAFKGTAHLHDFPLPMLNSFLAGTDIALKGKAAGDIDVEGQLDNPVLNGSLDLDSAHIYSEVYGFDFRMDEKPLVFENSRILFDSYNLYSTGKNPLVVNGDVDMQRLDRISLNLLLKADDFELINTEKKRKSMVFGKVYADFVGSLKGTTDNLSVRGKLDVQEKTDMTYILKDSPLTVDNRLDDLVQFVSFTDTATTEEAPEEASASFDLTLGINISDQAHFHCYLSEDGQNYIDLDGGGNLTLRITQQGDLRLAGKVTAESGEMKYELPVIPLRTFNIVQGSTVEFTGDPANPTLNVQAKERMKCLVTEDDQQRTVAFDVGVSITKSLEDMGLEFTIEAPEDLSIQNQLASMSKEQRNKAAVAMMATGMYLTDSGAQTSGFKANNALNAFLQNEIQNIAGNALKTVDLSVGVETGTSLAGTTTTDYSFQFSKRLWDDRIRVIIGGRVSAGKNADNRAESIINNVSIEYRMNKGATRYFRVFYDRDQQDPLEGQLTNTGVGYSVRKKTDRFGDLFIFWRKPKDAAAGNSSPSAGSSAQGTAQEN